jgi:hypothetical protein
VLDAINYRIRVIDAKGRIPTVAGTGIVGDGPPPGVPAVPALEANLNRISDLLFAGDHVYLAAMYNSRIKRVRLSDMTYENHVGVGRRTYYDGDGGPAIALGSPGEQGDVWSDDEYREVFAHHLEQYGLIYFENDMPVLGLNLVREALKRPPASDQIQSA